MFKKGKIAENLYHKYNLQIKNPVVWWHNKKWNEPETVRKEQPMYAVVMTYFHRDHDRSTLTRRDDDKRVKFVYSYENGDASHVGSSNCFERRR